MDPALAAHLNKALRGVSRDIGGPTRYDTVHAILIRWEEDYLNLQSKLDELDLVFQNYGFSTVVWLIPSFCAYFYLMDKAEELIEAKDSDRNLFILYYAGHGRVDRERHVVWSRTEDVWPVSVDSFEFQGLFANSTSDILNLFDSVAPTLATVKKSQNQVIETIAARGYNSSGYEMVDFSFTETLVEVLSDRITKGPFSVSMLHAELINRMLSRRSKGEWRRTPVHTVSHWTLKRRGGIELYRLQTLPPLAAPGSKSESNAQARLPASRTLFLNISLGNPLKHVDSAPWISWIRGYSPPNVHGVEFVSSQNPSLFSTPSFGLRVWLRDSFIPGSSAWLRWIEHIPGEVHAITVDIEKEDTPSDEDDIATFVAHLNLNAGVTDALRRNYYQKATVLPIMWGTPASNQIDVDYTKLYAERNDIQKELSDIGDVFKSRFNFNVEPIWEIPDDKPNCQQALNKKIQKLADEYDDGDALVIVLYGGHGADSRRKTSGYYNTSQETHCIWIAYASHLNIPFLDFDCYSDTNQKSKLI
jgi:hypothetical protein